jgi:OB-fold nucleic acid binding domain
MNSGNGMIMTVNETDKAQETALNETDKAKETAPTTGSIPVTNSDTDPLVDGIDDLNAQLAALTGAEHFLVGLTPHYWAHVPMLIADVHHLGLVNGLSCIVVRCDHCSLHEATSVSEIAEGGEAAAAVQFIPVSKCALVGVVVNVDRKSNGLTLYLIDDGTGLMDCVLWDESDYYKLPSLVDDDIGEEQPRFVVGDIVRVMGSLRIVSRSGLREQIFDAGGTAWEIHDGVREIQVSSMKHISEKMQNADPRRYCADPEHEHWIKCVEWKQRYGGKNATTIQNGVDTLRLLGQTSRRQTMI